MNNRSINSTPKPRAEWQRKPLVRFAYQGVKRLERIIGRHSVDGDRPFFDPDGFPWVPELENNWRTIRAELEKVLEHHDRLPNFQDISRDQITITQDNAWKTFILYGFGYRQERNCARCPETARLVESVPGMLTAFFSILAPGKHIPAHRGPYKGILRYHLGLIVPQPIERCRLRVADEYRTWREGGSLVFDDTYEHEVWNDTDGVRVVLFMDVVRRLPAPVSWLNTLIIAAIRRSSFIQDARRNAERFDLDQLFADT
ncbi:MAG: aspartyl/asparaginyl beta-hydroxylase domain-containing protein [Gammaproteobacteria bacterium]|nr:aspartyl/asparaginyl beta-hydroxylase domain-containing protein [Gammaproteobacteria bacterium]